MTRTVTITPTPSEPFDYVVQEGDSLDSIAERFDLGTDGALLVYFENQEVIEDNDGVLFVGQTIRIPPPGSVLPPTTPIPANLPRGTLIEYRVLPGDTLAGIAARFNSLPDEIVRESNIENPNALTIGRLLQIPVNLVTPTATLPPTSTPVTPTSPATLPSTPTLFIPTLTWTPTSTTDGLRPSTYTLRPGEFAFCIARRFDVDPDELLQLNNMSNGNVYDPGRILRIPHTGSFPGTRALRNHPATYTVALSSETLNTIACIFGDVHPSAIAQANDLSLDVILTAGQELHIP